jgi:YHS domain-containing protein
MQAPQSQPISTEPAEDPDFFPGEGLANKQLDGLDFEQGPARPPQQQQQFSVVPLQPMVQQQPGHGFAYPGPAAQQQPTPIITAGVVPPNVEPPPSLVKLPKPEELIVGAPIQTDYEMSADPKIPKKGFLGKFSAAPVPSQEPPTEPYHYVPNPAAHLADDDVPLAPSADVPGPEQDPAMAEIAKFSVGEPADIASAEPSAAAEKFAANPVVEELPPPVVTPSVRTVPVAAATTIGNAARAKASASELFKDAEPAPAAEPKVETVIVKPAAPKKTGGIAAGGFGPGKNVVPEQPEPAVPPGPVATVVPVPAPADPQIAREIADSAAPLPKAESASPYTGLSLDEPVQAPAPLMARENREMFFPPAAAEPTALPATETASERAPLPFPTPAELAPPAIAAQTVQPVSEAPAAKIPERSAYTQSKYEQIASRKGANGLKGFCPVRLRDHRDLADGQPQFRVQHNGRVYALSSAEALQTFLTDPEKYVPAASGYDVVVHQQSGETVEGVLDHSAWFKGRLYLFTSAENKDAFVSSPAAYAVK